MSDKIKFFFILCCTYFLLLFCGITSELSLGDETLHYRFAKDIFLTGKRVAYDSLYLRYAHSNILLPYNSEPLWHILLSFLWKISGKPSFIIAQVYHTFYYFLLILLIYLIGEKLYGEKHGLYSVLILATMPAIIVFSVLFYLDIPVTVLTTFCFLLILQKRILLASIAMGLVYVTKRNGYFFLPFFIFLIIYQNNNNLKKIIKNLLCFFAFPLFFITYDVLWRESNLKIKVFSESRNISSFSSLDLIKDRLLVKDLNFRLTEYLNSYFSNPFDIIKYFGVVLLILLVLYFLKKRYEKKDFIFLWLPIGCYLIFFFYIFSFNSDIRYLIPIMPFLSILAAKSLFYVNKRILKFLIILLCFLQFISTIIFVSIKRRISHEIKEGFVYLSQNTSKDSILLYPEYNILEGTERRFVWAGILNGSLGEIFWDTDRKTVEDIIKSLGINYIVVKKTRIYDDAKRRHFGGYPKSFMRRLQEFSFVECVFDNKEISIWQVK